MYEQILSEIEAATGDALRAYLLATLRDGTRSKAHNTHRIGQADRDWLLLLQRAFARLGHRAWIYREGAHRNYWVLETTADFLDVAYDASELIDRVEGLSYVRGYFDAEGGMPKRASDRLYFQLCQKNRKSIETVAQILESHGIRCGKPHNPSVRVDPEYWRIFVRASSWPDFMTLVGSWHPLKRPLVRERLMDLTRKGAQ